MKMNQNTNSLFLPILLGSDINVYGMARSFHEAYGVVSDAYCAAALSPTKFSKIVNVYPRPNFDQPEGFIKAMRELKESFKDDKRKLLLIPCSDGYTELIATYKSELEPVFICPTVNLDLQEKLSNKVSFYETCEEYGLPYPKTFVISKELADNGVIELPFSFPIALKPANSIEWLDIDFEGRKKAFILNTQSEFDSLIKTIYQAGYHSEMIAQDFIPGDDSKMRVLNVYVDQNHQVRMMCLGHPLLEDPTPDAVGNYVAIMPDYNERLFSQIKTFLEKIKYTGYANFDMKFDERDGHYKLFEINLRQGRSSFYVTLMGYNLARYFVEDYVLEIPFSETVYAKGNALWIGVPVSLLKRYIEPSKDKSQALKYIQNGNFGSTISYKKDMNLKRFLLIQRIFNGYHKRYRSHFRKK